MFVQLVLDTGLHQNRQVSQLVCVHTCSVVYLYARFLSASRLIVVYVEHFAQLAVYITE